jgi:hypothetical protein
MAAACLEAAMSFSVRVAGMQGAEQIWEPERLEWTALGTYGRAQFRLLAETLDDPIAWLGKDLQVLNDWGEVLWRGFVCSLEYRGAAGALAFGLEGLTNRLRALYRSPDDPQLELMGPWVEDLGSQVSYGVHEKLLRLGVCRAESAAELVTAELKARAWPAAAIGVDRSGKGWKMEARGWLESLRWRNVDLDNSLAGQLDPATGTVDLQDCLALIFGNCGAMLSGWKLLPGNERRLPWPGWPLGDGLSQLRKLVRLIAAGGERLTVHVDTSNFVSLEVQEPSPAEIVGQIAADGIAYDLQGRALAEGTYPVGGYWRWGGAAVWADKLCWEQSALRFGS